MNISDHNIQLLSKHYYGKFRFVSCIVYFFIIPKRTSEFHKKKIKNTSSQISISYKKTVNNNGKKLRVTKNKNIYAISSHYLNWIFARFTEQPQCWNIYFLQNGSFSWFLLEGFENTNWKWQIVNLYAIKQVTFSG